MALKIVRIFLLSVFLFSSCGKPETPLTHQKIQLPSQVPTPTATEESPQPGSTPSISPTAIPEWTPLEAVVNAGLPLDKFPARGTLSIRFNRSMDPVSSSDALFTYPYIDGKLTWADKNTVLNFTPNEEFIPGREYTVYLDRNLKSAAGESFVYTQLWQLKIQNRPKVLGHTPSTGRLWQRRPGINISFDKEMDDQSVADAFSILPALDYTLVWNGNRLSVRLLEPLTPGIRYLFTVGATAKDVNGISIGEDYRWAYWIEEFKVSVGELRRNDKSIIVSFNYPINREKTGLPFTLQPPLAGEWQWSSEYAAKFLISDTMPLGTQYTVQFTGPLFDKYSDGLPEPTEAIKICAPPPIISVLPKPLNALNPELGIRVVFDQSVDHASVENAFHVTPEIEGVFEWLSNTMIFKPEPGFPPDRTYTASLDTTALNANGEKCFCEPYSWSFYLPYGLLEGAFFSESGSNIQVLDADGRRAVQFGFNMDMPATITLDLYRYELGKYVSLYEKDYKVQYYSNRSSIDIEGATPFFTWHVIYDAGGIQEFRVPENVPPGLYVINLRIGDKVTDQLFLILTKNTVVAKWSGNEVLVWVSDINGESLANAEVRLYSTHGEKIRVGKTDGMGIYRTTVPEGYSPLLVAARGEGDDFTISGLDHSWNSTSGSWWWWFGTRTAETKQFNTYIYTDRPIYKPGQVVYYKVILRQDHDVKYSLPPENTPVTVRIHDARDNIIQTAEARVNDFGTANGEFHLAEGAMLGNYWVEVIVKGEKYKQKFKVQDYRKPDFQVSLSTDKTQYVDGELINIDIDVNYFFGKPVSNANLTIRQYHLTDNYWGCGCQDESEQGTAREYNWSPSPYQKVVKTDQNGHQKITLYADMNEGSRQKSDWWSSQEFSIWGIEVTASDGSDQPVSASIIYKVYNSPEIINLKTDGYYKAPGKPFTVQAEARTILGQPVSGRELTIEVRRWDKASWDYNLVVSKTKLITGDNGVASIPFTIVNPGFYQLRLKGADDHGYMNQTNRWIYIFSIGSPWRIESGQEIKISAEQDSYKPYQTARLAIESTFSGPAVLTFERGRVNRVRPITLTAPITLVEVEIIPEDAPNIFVTVNAWQAQDTHLRESYEDYYYGTNLPDSRLRTATVELKVDSSAKELNVEITPDKSTYKPRERATVTITVTDSQGRPVQAEVSLALVDESIYSLSPDLSRSIFPAFYGRRVNTVMTFNSMAPWREIYVPGRGGGGDGGILGNPRSDFPDTAAWFPALQTDQNGKVTVSLNLPDNLTSWRLNSRAITKSSLVGQSSTNITTQQEIIVRPIVPRTLASGDLIELSALVHNFSDGPQDIEVTFLSEAFDWIDPPSYTITLRPGEMRVVGGLATAGKSGETEITVTAKGALGSADAVRLPMTIQPVAVPDIYSEIGEFTTEFSTILTIPEGALDESGLHVQLSRSLAGNVLYGLEYLTGYPYGCVEQTMSRALPNAVVGRALTQLGIQDVNLEAKLPDLINAGLQKLYGFQHEDGGWGWWFDDYTNDYQTAWVVFGLSVTANTGTSIDPKVIERGVKWLSEHLSEMDIRTRAFAIYSMTLAGQEDMQSAQDLAAQFYTLDSFSQAALVMALWNMGEKDQARQLMNSLVDTSAHESDWVYWPNTEDDGGYDQKTMASALRSTAMVLDALVLTDPENPLIPGVVRYLVEKRRPYGWGTTNETAFAVIALTDYLVSTAADQTSLIYTITLNGQSFKTGTLGKEEPTSTFVIQKAQLKDGPNHLEIRHDSANRLYYAIASQVYIPQTKIKPAGVVSLTRIYEDLSGRRIETVQKGQLVRVKLIAKLPESASFVILEDHLPGGLEALNEKLNTTSHDGNAFSMEGYNAYYWERYGYNKKEVYGDRVSFFITQLTENTFTFTYLARATYEGTFTALPAEIYAMYDPLFWGRSASATLVISPES